MKRKPGLILFLLIMIFRGFGQESEPLHGIYLTVISQVNQGSSYITFPIDTGKVTLSRFTQKGYICRLNLKN